MDTEIDKQIAKLFQKELELSKDYENAIKNAFLKLKYNSQNRGIRNKKIIYRRILAICTMLFVCFNIVVIATTLKPFSVEEVLAIVDLGTRKSIEQGYIQNVDMPFVKSKDIGFKVETILMDQSQITLIFTIETNSNLLKREDINMIDTDMIITDENKNILYCYDQKAYQQFCRRNKIEPKEFTIGDLVYTDSVSNISILEKNDTQITVLMTMQSTRSYPESNHLSIYINEIDFQYRTKQGKYKQIERKGSWAINIDISKLKEKKEVLSYKIDTTSNEINIEDFSAQISNSGMKISFLSTENIPMETKLTTPDGRRFQCINSNKSNNNNKIRYIIYFACTIYEEDIDYLDLNFGNDIIIKMVKQGA